MKVFLLLAHPDPSSYNSAIASTVRDTLQENSHQVWFHDLYHEHFDPLLYHSEFPQDARIPAAIETHCRQVSEADGIVIIHPNWWGQPPAILKGWIDRVIRPGVAYRFAEGDAGEGVPIGLLKAHTAVVFNTSNTKAEREKTIFGDPLERIWKDCVFDLCGVKHFYRRMFRIIVTSTPEQRQQWLDEVKEITRSYFPSE